MATDDPILRYVVTVYSQPPGTPSVRATHTKRTTVLDRAVQLASDYILDSPTAVNVTVASKHASGATRLVGSAHPRTGFTYASNDKETDTMTTNLATWDEVLALNDNQIDAANRAGRPTLTLPFSDTVLAKLEPFSRAYAEYLAGSRKTNAIAKTHDLSAADARIVRGAVRRRIAKAVARAERGAERDSAA